MTTLTVDIQVSDEAATAWQNTPTNRQKLRFLVETFVERAETVSAADRIKQSMDALSDEANRNGLTDDRLVELLREIDDERSI